MPDLQSFWSYLLSGAILLGVTSLLKGQREHRRMHQALNDRLLVIETTLKITTPHNKE